MCFQYFPHFLGSAERPLEPWSLTMLRSVFSWRESAAPLDSRVSSPRSGQQRRGLDWRGWRCWFLAWNRYTRDYARICSHWVCEGDWQVYRAWGGVRGDGDATQGEAERVGQRVQETPGADPHAVLRFVKRSLTRMLLLMMMMQDWKLLMKGLEMLSTILVHILRDWTELLTRISACL